MTGCMVDGRMIGTFPDEGCLRSPAQDKCAAINYECPDGFVTSSGLDFTKPPCVPLSYEDVKQATRERQVLNQNRCPEGHRLDVDLDDDDGRGNVGRCILQ